jgi:flagellar hook-length control protein FliK
MNGLSEAKITLIPEHLGQLQVKIAMQNGQLTAQLMAETTVARDLLENQLPQLRAALQSQGIQVEKLEVTYHNSQLESGFFQQRDGQQPYQQFRQPERAKTAGYEQYEDSFIHELDESAAAGIQLYANGSIDVTA